MPNKETLERWIGSVFPSVTTSLCRVMQPTLYRYVWRVSSSQQVRLCVLTLIMFPLSVAPLELQRWMIDGAIGESDVRLLLTLGGAYVLVVAMHGIVKYGVNVFRERVSEGVVRVLRRRVTETERQSEALGHGARVSMLAAESERIGGFVGEAIAVPMMQGGTLLSVLAYMLYLQPLMAAVAAAFVLPSVVLFPRIQAVVDRYVETRTRLLRDLGDVVTQEERRDRSAIGGEEASDKIIGRIYDTRIKIFIFKFLQKAIFNLLGAMGPACILIVGGWLVIEGRAEVGVIVAFLSGFERILDPTRELLNFYRRMRQTRVQYQLILQAVA